MIEHPGIWSIPVSYTAFNIDDRLVAAMALLTDCKQEIHLPQCAGTEETSYWSSLSGDKWNLAPGRNCRWEL